MSQRVVMDASFLAPLLDPSTPTRRKPEGITGELSSRLEFLIRTLDQERAEVIIPTPSLAEVLTVAGRDPADVLTDFAGQARLSVVDFDQRAAIECGLMLRQLLPRGARGNRSKPAVKFDAQILAIAKVAEATVIYTDDDTLAERAIQAGLQAIKLWELPEPPVDPQHGLPFDASSPADTASTSAGRSKRRRP